MPADAGLPVLLTYAEVSKALRVSEMTIRRMVDDGSIRAIRLRAGGSLRISADEVRRFVESPPEDEAS
jgi:excisionase family DNA binding protein